MGSSAPSPVRRRERRPCAARRSAPTRAERGALPLALSPPSSAAPLAGTPQRGGWMPPMGPTVATSAALACRMACRSQRRPIVQVRASEPPTPLERAAWGRRPVLVSRPQVHGSTHGAWGHGPTVPPRRTALDGRTRMVSEAIHPKHAARTVGRSERCTERAVADRAQVGRGPGSCPARSAITAASTFAIRRVGSMGGERNHLDDRGLR